MPLTAVARIGKPRGIRGEVWIDFYRWDFEALEPGGGIWVSSSEGSPESHEIVSFFRYDKGAVLKLSGVDTVELASLLSGREVLLDESEVPPEPPGTFDAEGIRGFAVVDTRRGRIGEARGARDIGPYWILDAVSGNRSFEIPAVKGLGVEVNQEESVIRVSLPDAYPGVDDED
ncbi:MAG: hypothetical protein P8Z49_06535 [Acidobacteriota bacterium]